MRTNIKKPSFFQLISVVFFLLLAPHAGLAKKLYKYQDENGNWIFTDTAPKSQAQELESKQLKVNERQSKVAIRKRGPDSAAALHIINEYFGPVEVELVLTESQNLKVFPALPKRFVVPAASEIRAVSLRPTRANRSFSYRIDNRFMIGDPKAQHRPKRPYRVPFETGQSFPISQAFNGSFSHNMPSSQHAVDFAMPEGSHVVAAREGIVMDVANDFFSGGVHNKFMSKANLIRILHDDGTMAVYGHLRLESAQVTPGVRVKRGQRIAKSGNTGFSSGPHLHFAIQVNKGLALHTVPFEFADENNQPIVPKRGMVLTAY